jgi:hypothetical protein
MHDRSAYYDICLKQGKTYYCTHCLWDKTKHVQVQKVSVDKFNINDIKWSDGNTPVTIAKVMKDTDCYHYRRIINADMSFPLLIRGSMIIDGCHRLVKAVKILALTQVDCVTVSDDILRQCVWVPQANEKYVKKCLHVDSQIYVSNNYDVHCMECIANSMGSTLKTPVAKFKLNEEDIKTCFSIK